MARARLDLVRDAYRAFETADRDLVDGVLGADLAFYSPADPGIDRVAYFERCWPNAGRVRSFEYVRLVEVGDEVLVTYEAERKDGKRFRNTEIFGFEDGRIGRIEVYFGWDL